MKIKELGATVAGVALIVGAIAAVAVLQPAETPVTVVQSPTPVLSTGAEVIPIRPVSALESASTETVDERAIALTAEPAQDTAPAEYEEEWEDDEYEDHDDEDHDDDGDDDDD